jgi:endonuclease G
MKLTEALLRRAEAALTFDPRQQRRALLDRTAVAVADAPTLRRRIVQALGEGADAAQLAIDRLVGGTDQLNVSYLERGMIAADAVGRIEVRNDDGAIIGCATGFMISPRLLLTNHHVLPTADDAARSGVDFRYEFDALGRLLEACVFAFDPSAFFFTDAALDVTVVAVAPETSDGRQRVARFGWLGLSSSRDTVLPGEWLTMVHHPGGGPKQVALRQNLLIECCEQDLWYASETAAATSGAPVFNDSWQVVAVHRAGAPARDASGAILTVDGEHWTDASDESRIVWRAGTGIRVCAVLERLAAEHGDHPFLGDVLGASDRDAADAVLIPLGSGIDADAANDPPPEHARSEAMPHVGRTIVAPEPNGDARATSDPNADALTVTVPLRITVRPGNGGGREPFVGVNVS